MSAVEVTCPSCRSVLADALFNQPEFAPCPACEKPLRVLAFPALYRPAVAVSSGERLLVDSDASCFYHPQKKAEIPCDQCGRFLCALCDVPMGDRHVCPACVESGRSKGTLASLQNKRTLYDTATLLLGVLPLLLIFPFFYFSFVMGPAAIIVGLYGWKKPGSIVPRGRWRFVVGIIGGVIQIGILVFFGAMLFNEIYS